MTVVGYHLPVMLREVVDYLQPSLGNTFVDVTLGGAGHAKAILKAIGPDGTFIGIDRDEDALDEVKEVIDSYRNASAIHGRMGDIKNILKEMEIKSVDGILADLGVSSHQFDVIERGFSFRGDAPLDMRMDRSKGESASELLSRLDEDELVKILSELGEERYSKRIARAIASSEEIKTTGELAGLIQRSVPPPARYKRIHPATRTFQAIRIAVNDELGELRNFLNDAPHLLSSGGRVAVISYHSLEDRMVKWAFRELAMDDEFSLPKRKTIKASDDEIDSNPRARSARLRILERN
ncbi:MAG: 16S rRNA (cytosine(1402)-N(4))-methyltransferase RsmH [Deltaproteobacteria bacterium]|jgi:16S rRNA (cytosine1402-N4)-methyltransferase|nr:16S rRNA (cytosine(1402)-N(4))-methyltransferase RsmH [Deltaproteobacteria bacterium]